MRLQTNTIAPAFETKDVFDAPFSLTDSNKGKKVFLVFMRFAGCPVCNLHVNYLLKNADRFKKKNINVIIVYESSKAVMHDYLENEKYPFTFIADPENKLYKLYSVETSFTKLLASFFKGILAKVIAGKKLYKKKITDDGKVTRMEAEFLIDETGKISIAHYSEFLGDNVQLNDFLK